MIRLPFRLGVLVLAVAPVFAQTLTPAARFDVADVRLAAPNPSPNNSHGGVLRGDRYEIRNATMLFLISTAYGVAEEKVTGGPSWVEMNRFDVAAEVPPNTPPAAVRTMLQALLADRFKLVVREDKEQLPGHILKATAKTKLRQAEGDQPSCEASQRAQANGTVLQHMVCKNLAMAGLANRLAQPAMAADYFAGQVVTNETGLGGRWDFELDWTPRAQLVQAGSDGVSIQKALENIGLKVEEGKVASSVLVVDSVNATPTPPDVASKLSALPVPEFDVASLKPSPPEATTARSQLQAATGQINFTATPLRQLLNFAWGVRNDDYLVAPGWVESKRFDLIAKPYATPVSEAWRDSDRLLLMLRQLLVSRFKMKYHTENRLVGAFVLTADSPKLTKAEPSSRTRCVDNPTTGRNPALTRLITCQNVTMAQFAALLPTVVSGYVTAPVADMTSLSGSWDFSVNYSPENVFTQGTRGGGNADVAAAPSGVLSIFEAMDRQLGLQLKPQRRSLPVMVIDSMSEDVGN